MSLNDRLTVANHRGDPVPRTLGFLLGAAVLLAALAHGGVTRPGWVATGALLAVLVVGVVDDLSAQSARGIRNHLRALVAGQPTTGIAKLVVIGAAATAVAAAPTIPVSLWAVVVRAVLVAGMANLGNALDVRPGRALKVMVPVCLVGLLGPWADQPYLPGLLVALGPALALDLRERAMLGDGGSNLVGFAAGIALASVADGAWLAVLALLVTAGNVLAETVSLSEVIDRVAVLRAFDRLGRRPG